MNSATPVLREQADAGGPGIWAASGHWTLKALAGRFNELEQQIRHAASAANGWDLSGIVSLDGAGALLLWRGWGHRRPGGLALRPEHEAIFGAKAGGSESTSFSR